MTWKELCKTLGDLEAAKFSFANPLSVVGAPERPALFKALVNHWFGEDSPYCFQWHPWNERQLELACKFGCLCIIGCANSSKTDFGAMWGIVNWMCSPHNTLVLVTSTSLKDSRKRMWGRVTTYLTGLPAMPGQIVDSIGMVRSIVDGKKLADNAGIALIAGEKKHEREAIGRIIGMKQQRLIFVADELPELSPALTNAFFSNLEMNPQAQFLGIGNFASMYDALGEIARPKNGYASITPDDTEWETDKGWCLRLDGLKSPNFDYPTDKWKFVYNRKNLLAHRKNLGDNSAAFWRMCRSFPCPISADNTIYSEADFISSLAHETVEFDSTPTSVAACDPSYTHDGDRCPLQVGAFGMVKGKPTLQYGETIMLTEDVRKMNESRDFQIARLIMEHCRSRNVLPKNTAIDSTGAGKPFLSILHELWTQDVIGVEFGGSASQLPVFTHDRRPASDLYANRVSELWVCGRDYLRGGQLKGVGADAARELKARQYRIVKTALTRQQVESKKDMKARVGWSPDLGDTMMILLDLCRQRFGFLADTGKQSFGQMRRRFRDRALELDEVYHVRYSGN